VARAVHHVLVGDASVEGLGFPPPAREQVGRAVRGRARHAVAIYSPITPIAPFAEASALLSHLPAQTFLTVPS